jgi:hypothetical protein
MKSWEMLGGGSLCRRGDVMSTSPPSLKVERVGHQVNICMKFATPNSASLFADFVRKQLRAGRLSLQFTLPRKPGAAVRMDKARH